MTTRTSSRIKKYHLAARLAWLSLTLSPALLPSQRLLDQAAQQPGPGSVLTLDVQSRLVIEDVLVTDAHGRPVHGLPRSAFHIFDQGKPQAIRNFEEGAPPTDDVAKLPQRALPTGVFSNAGSMQTRTASEVLLIDADDLEVQDQMFLLDQLRRAIATLPPGLQVAIFRVSGGRVVQIRGMTTDREDLRRALAECIPVLTHPIDSKFGSAVDQLLTVAAFLEQTPGRKNVLWFAGQFPLVPVTGDEQAPGGFTVDYQARQNTIHQIQEALAEARIAVYPVDVRGVLSYGIAPPGARGPQAPVTRNMGSATGMNTRPSVSLPGGDGIVEERDQMRQLAAATGGKAYMLNNLSEEIEQAFDLGVRAYAITYTPAEYSTDESWHKVKITVDGGYHLSYRPGYLATSTGVPGGRQGFRLEDGKKVSTRTSDKHDATKPILFTVKVVPESAKMQPGVKKGRLRIALTFRIPADQLMFVHADDRWKSDLLVCSYAYDSDGKMKGGKLQEVDTVLTDEQWQRAQKQELPAQQEIDVPKDAGYLLMAVRDKRSKRIGNFLLSMRAVRALQGASLSSEPPASGAPRAQQTGPFAPGGAAIPDTPPKPPTQ